MDLEEALKRIKELENKNATLENKNAELEAKLYRANAFINELLLKLQNQKEKTDIAIIRQFESKTEKIDKIVIDEAIDYNNDGAFNWDDVASLIKNDIETNSFKYVSYLNEDGDFRSAECVELLKEADIIVTNPPFSLFREFIALLEKYNKKYLIIGNKNAITYKETFALIKANKLWLGYNNVSTFVKPDGTEKKFGNIGWFTNLDTYIRHTELDLYKKYNEADYPKYDNYDAINVDRVADIPCDYFGVMGVPITFLDKYNPDQFEIIGKSSDLGDMTEIRKMGNAQGGGPRFYIMKNDTPTRMYERIVIRKKLTK